MTRTRQELEAMATILEELAPVVAKYSEDCETILLGNAHRIRNESNAEGCILSDDIRVPLDSLEADAGYLIGRVQADGSCGSAIVETIKQRCRAIRAALAAPAQALSSPGADGEPLTREQIEWMRKELVFIDEEDHPGLVGTLCDMALQSIAPTQSQAGAVPVAWMVYSEAPETDPAEFFHSFDDAKAMFDLCAPEDEAILMPLYTSPPAAKVEEGWKLMPLEADNRMVNAGANLLQELQSKLAATRSLQQIVCLIWTVMQEHSKAPAGEEG